MANKYLDSVIPVLAVNKLSEVHEFYKSIFGETDIEPAEGVAEWEVVEGHYIQVTEIPERAGKNAVVVGCTDIAAFVAELREKNIEVSDPVDYGVVIVAVTTDPAGNEIQFAQVVDE
ncbi:VOC family protein [Corynebacterium lubricantis]|uniref:VOC family protein n=1 Tax=Corynebacterium lubricantis TaxID=541095 RepID=UPI00037C23CF|nr:glyoxalase/bleomycin resistance/dioxygenase family protein [Corynebacterium lubricantis]